jgi:predicted glutamine amidotransferase
MCKLFFSFQYPNSKKLLKEFFNKSNEEHLEYGYGISWYNKKWNTYKCNCYHMTDQNNEKMIKNINSNIIMGHIRNIYHENMTSAQICNEIKIENVQPFQYNEYLFMHHGDIFLEYNNELNNYQLKHNDKEFKIVKKNIMNHISPQFKKQIYGTTDSEILFFLLLSIKNLLIKQDKLLYLMFLLMINLKNLSLIKISGSKTIVKFL